MPMRGCEYSGLATMSACLVIAWARRKSGGDLQENKQGGLL
jgi:hypothetical protein